MKTTLPRVRLLDVGGTFIKCQDGRQIPVPSAGSREAVAAAFSEAVGPVASLKGIGIAIPGPFDYRNGIFLMKHKYASVYGECFRDLAGVPENVPVKYLHDVNAPLLGIVKMAGLESENVALVTLGTGLGFSYAVHGEVQCSESGGPAFGLWNRPWNGGILEDRISARGISSAYAALTGDSTPGAYDIACKAFSGEDAAAGFSYTLSFAFRQRILVRTRISSGTLSAARLSRHFPASRSASTQSSKNCGVSRYAQCLNPSMKRKRRRSAGYLKCSSVR